MDMIETSRGPMAVSDLAYSEGVDQDDENCRVSWQEWRAADGEIVKRNASVEFKRWPGATGEAGGF
jgi:hypothetical protein